MTTPTYSAPLDDVTTAVLDLLRGDNRLVYDAGYGGDPTAPTYPYSILYRVAGGNGDPMPDLDGDTRTLTVAYQVTAVSNLRNQCEHAARATRDRLLARTPAGAWAHELVLPAGWQCIDRRPDPAMPGVDRVGDPPTVLFNQPARYLLTVTPT